MKKVMLLTKANRNALPALYTTDGQGFDATVQVKLFTPDSSWTWLATEFDPTTGSFFGWADNGQGGGELGYFELSELETARGPMGLPIERDRHFAPKSLRDALKSEGLGAGSIAAPAPELTAHEAEQIALFEA